MSAFDLPLTAGFEPPANDPDFPEPIRRAISADSLEPTSWFQLIRDHKPRPCFTVLKGGAE
jgi:hypothetical protein